MRPCPLSAWLRFLSSLLLLIRYICGLAADSPGETAGHSLGELTVVATEGRRGNGHLIVSAVPVTPTGMRAELCGPVRPGPAEAREQPGHHGGRRRPGSTAGHEGAPCRGWSAGGPGGRRAGQTPALPVPVLIPSLAHFSPILLPSQLPKVSTSHP